MQVAIVAGGLGTRLGSLTRNQPKSMVRILGRPFLEYQLEFLRKGGIQDVVLCLGYFAKQIQEYFGNGSRFGVKISYSIEDKPLDTAGALKLAENMLSDSFFTLYGDSFLSLDFAAISDCFEASNKLALMTVYRNQNLYDSSNTAVEAGLVKYYSKKIKTPDTVYIDYGATLLRKSALQLIPGATPYSMESLFQQLIENNELLAYEVNERFYEIGSPTGLREFEALIRRK